MGNITLNKPSGGQLTLSPEDGTSTETVTIPSVGVGKVLQAVQGRDTADGSISATANVWYDTNLFVTITPSSSSSKILVMANGQAQPLYNQASNSAIRFRIVRDGTDITGMTGLNTAPSNGENQTASNALFILDTPATTSAVTYRLQVSGPSNQTIYVNRSYSQTGLKSTIIAQEVAA